jgi:hypothetical protein
LRNATFTQGETIVAEQRKWVADLERERHDTRQSKELLAQSEEVQALHVATATVQKKRCIQRVPAPSLMISA